MTYPEDTVKMQNCFNVLEEHGYTNMSEHISLCIGKI